jgi:enamine deaminase RidA (YjgF/YER057c/UK114 family)
MRRRAIQKGRRHAAPIPSACRIGPIMMSSVILGTDPADHSMPEDIETQAVNMFVNLKDIAEAAGGSTDDIVMMTIWAKDPGNIEAVNREWLQMFPEFDTRPARHTMQFVGEGPGLIRCTITMVCEDE